MNLIDYYNTEHYCATCKFSFMMPKLYYPDRIVKHTYCGATDKPKSINLDSQCHVFKEGTIHHMFQLDEDKEKIFLTGMEIGIKNFKYSNPCRCSCDD